MLFLSHLSLIFQMYPGQTTLTTNKQYSNFKERKFVKLSRRLESFYPASLKSIQSLRSPDLY